MMPGSVSIVTDAIGLTVLLVAPMPILTKLAVAGSFWVLSNLVTVVILDPILCCYFPTPRECQRAGGPLARSAASTHRPILRAPVGRIVVIAVFAVVIVWSVYCTNSLLSATHAPARRCSGQNPNTTKRPPHHDKFQAPTTFT